MYVRITHLYNIRMRWESRRSRTLMHLSFDDSSSSSIIRMISAVRPTNGCTVLEPSAAVPADYARRSLSSSWRACSETRSWSATRWVAARWPATDDVPPSSTYCRRTRVWVGPAERLWTPFLVVSRPLCDLSSSVCEFLVLHKYTISIYTKRWPAYIMLCAAHQHCLHSPCIRCSWNTDQTL